MYSSVGETVGVHSSENLIKLQQNHPTEQTTGNKNMIIQGRILNVSLNMLSWGSSFCSHFPPLSRTSLSDSALDRGTDLELELVLGADWGRPTTPQGQVKAEK